MAYRDLIPGRRNGRVIGSHIRIPDGGPVPDYVHYHHVAFQIIFCVRGWVRVVYEDQGPSFVMEPGDCVLQPPQIRHRVLECSDGLEVVEISAPAEHRTVADRSLALPTAEPDRGRLFGGQRFVLHRTSRAAWLDGPTTGWESCNTGIDGATGGLGSVTVLRTSSGEQPLRLSADGGLSFQFVLRGAGRLQANDGGVWRLGPSDGFVVPAEAGVSLSADPDGLALLRVQLDEAVLGD
jgi:quercetin dioxygenase-like cupin family protein